MAGRARHDIEESKDLIVFEDFISRHFATQDFGENIIRIVVRHCALHVYASVGQSSYCAMAARFAISPIQGANSCGTASMWQARCRRRPRRRAHAPYSL